MNGKGISALSKITKAGSIIMADILGDVPPDVELGGRRSRE
jgi:hypothetical protein